MNPELWRQVEELYHSALERKPEERGAYLVAACHGDEELQREVESLLAQDDESPEGLLDRPALQAAPNLIDQRTETHLTPGAQLGPYRIENKLGEGGMGAVFRAVDTRLGRAVAIKIAREQFSARFEQEASTIAALNHPNICTLHDVGPNYLVMELIDGPTLADQIKQGAIPAEDALAIARQIIDAIEAAHEKGIIHRDLKPANIKVKPDGTVKVLDFGLAKSVEPLAGDVRNSPTRTGMILGTAAYMSPEQASGKAVDQRTDIWAFGCVLYEILTRQPAFPGETATDILAAIVTKNPDLTPVPARFRRLLSRCFEKDPKKRLRDIGDAWDLLEYNTEAPAVAARAPRRAYWWTVATGAFAIALIVSWWILWRATQPVSQPLVRLSVELPEFALDSSIVPAGAAIALSPDGRRIVYTGRGADGTMRLYARSLDQDQSTPLPGTEGASGPFFSPEGKYVAFFADDQLKRTSAEHAGIAVLANTSGALGGSWDEDGNIIAALSLNASLSRIPSTGGAMQPVTELRTDARTGRREFGHAWPQILPGAREMLFTSLPAPGTVDEPTIEAQSLRGGERRTVVRGGSYGRYLPSGHLLYLRQGTLYAAPFDVGRLELTGPAMPIVEEVMSNSSWGFAQEAFSHNGTLAYIRGKAAAQTIAWLDSTGEMQPLRAPAAHYSGPIRFSPDGKRLAVSIEESRAEGVNDNVWVYDLERDTMTRLTYGPQREGFPVWTPDGKHIIFNSDRQGNGASLYWIRADGAGEVVRLTEAKNFQFPASISPDGKRLVFNELAKDRRNSVSSWTLPLDDVQSDHPKARKPEPLLVTSFNETTGVRISPDGRWLAYQSDESGHNEVYVRPFPAAGGKWQVSIGGGNAPVWSGEAPELFYRSGAGLMVASYTTKGEAFVAGNPRLWAAKKNLGPYFDLAPDGKRFAIVEAEAVEQKGQTSVTILLNFFDELGRRARASGN